METKDIGKVVSDLSEKNIQAEAVPESIRPYLGKEIVVKDTGMFMDRTRYSFMDDCFLATPVSDDPEEEADYTRAPLPYSTIKNILALKAEDLAWINTRDCLDGITAALIEPGNFLVFERSQKEAEYFKRRYNVVGQIKSVE